MRSKRFERWFAKFNKIDREDVAEMWNGDTYISYTYFIEIAWAAWREAIDGVTQ